MSNEAPVDEPSVNTVNKRKSRPKRRKRKKSNSSPETSASPTPNHPQSSKPPPDPKPRYKAEFLIQIRVDKVGKHRITQRVVGDTGCSKSAMSEDFFLRSPHLQSRPYRPLTTRGHAINGSKVLTMGIVNVAFRINGRFHTTNFRVVKGLVQDIFLGWDWFSSSGAVMNPANGTVDFPKYGDSAPLIPDTAAISGCYYRVAEDFVVPANSKAICKVEAMTDNLDCVSSVVETEPFNHATSDVWANRCLSVVSDGLFPTEFINCQKYPIRMEKGRVLGFAKFHTKEEMDIGVIQTEMYCQYGDNAPAEAEAETEAKAPDEPCLNEGNDDDDECIEEIICDPPPTQPQTGRTVPSCEPQDTPPPKPPDPPGSDNSIPTGAKKLHIDWSKLSKRALPYKARLKQLLEVKHAKAFSRHDRDYGRTSLVHYRANLKDKDQPPIHVPAYRTRPEMRETIDNQAYEMIADGVIAHSTSPFSAPILLARKKCGGWRFLTDFRRINDRCNKVVFPLPRIEDSLQKLDKPEFFTSLDLTKGFWQIPIHPKDRKYFAFSTESMHLEYLVAPMGAKNSPSTLCALMQLVLRGLPPQHVLSYLDDILVASNTMEDHMFFLDQVLTALERAGLKLNPSKCSIAQDSVVCLGHLLSKDGVSPDPANLEKIRAWNAPENAKQLKTFLGLTGYYRQFVKDYSKIAQCLTDLTHDGVAYVWKEEHQRAFEDLKRILTSEQVMAYPDFSKPFIIKSDASIGAIGYVLTQKIDGKEKVITYGSKKLSATQKRWSTYDREFFALLCGIRANAHYLRHAAFIAVTDHRPLLAWKKVDQQKDPTGRRTRWAMELDTYEFELLYKQGKIHADADALSRMGGDDDEEAVDDEAFTALLGMDEEDEHSAVTINANKDARARLRSEQDEDPVISEVKKYLKDRKRIPRSFPNSWYVSNAGFLSLQKGILYKRSYSETIHGHVLQAVIPESMKDEVMLDLHGEYMAGHPSPEKMLLKLKRYAIWPTIKKDVEDFVTNCTICDQEREPVPRNRTPRVPLEANNVWDWVMCDLLKLSLTTQGYLYVLVFIDVFSGFVKLYKLKNKSTEGVCRAFENLTCLIGPPRLLTSDNGKEFTSDLLTKMCEVVGAKKRTSVPYRPQSQGAVERFNRTLIKDLRKRLMQHGKTWVDHLQYAEWAYNTTPRANSKMSPYLLMYGREPPLPTFVDVDAKTITDKSLRKFFEESKSRSKECYDEARRRIIMTREKEVEAYNKKAKHKPLKAGDKVYEAVPDGLREKLEPRWDNKMEVVRRRIGPKGNSGTTYECKKDDGKQCVRNYEQLKLSLVTKPSDSVAVAPLSEPAEPIAHRTRRRQAVSDGPDDWLAVAAVMNLLESEDAPTPSNRVESPTEEPPMVPAWLFDNVREANPSRVPTSEADEVNSPARSSSIWSSSVESLAGTASVSELPSIPPLDPRQVDTSSQLEHQDSSRALAPVASVNPKSSTQPEMDDSTTPAPGEDSEDTDNDALEDDVFDGYQPVRPQHRRQRKPVEPLALSVSMAMTSADLQDDHPAPIENVQTGGAEAAADVDPNAGVVPGFDATRSVDAGTASAARPSNQTSEVVPVGEHEVGAQATSTRGDKPSRNKGTGKNHPGSRIRSQDVRSKTEPYAGAMTRRRERQMRIDEDNINKGMSKLVTTGKKLINRNIQMDDLTDTSDESPPVVNPIADFSSHDLIRRNVANPQIFDEPIPVQPSVSEIARVSVNSLPSNVSEASSVLSILNPFSYYMRKNDTPSGAEAGPAPKSSVGRVESIADDANIDPQLSSTPKQ